MDTSLSAHPRRPAAQHSVSLLRHEYRGTAPSISISQSPNTSISPSSSKPIIGKDDSGESSNAEGWFEKSNNRTAAKTNSFVDNDPPFFLRNSSSGSRNSSFEERRPNGGRTTLFPSNYPAYSLPNKNGAFEAEDSSTGDFRGVIDDLTIQNKKLKRRLKKYEQLHDSHLKNDRLFEVRFHGLPPAKKIELEDMLRKFAVGMSSQAAATPSQPPPQQRMPPALSKMQSYKTNFADSAYVSASGQGTASAQSSSDSDKKHSSSSAANMLQRSLQTYLHDMPDGQRAHHHPVAMTDKDKKKLIVRRLEQVFAGKLAVDGAHHHPQQQQQVSQLAAQDDRSAHEASGQQFVPEGVREARIMPEEVDQHSGTPSVEDESVQSSIPVIQNLSPETKVEEHDFAEPRPDAASSDQRPTRPLDLDLQRAQVPADNMSYIRHLGFSPPHASSMEAPVADHGWIYLNVLTNMAQLHIINVTTDFVKDSLSAYSKKFEVSPDGRKVRWRGGKSPTHNSDGDATPSAASNVAVAASEQVSPRKRPATSDDDNKPSNKRYKAIKESVESQQRKLVYTPLFHHRQESDDSDGSSSDEDDMSEYSSEPLQQAGPTSMMNGLVPVTGATPGMMMRRKKRDMGPVVFYNNAKFCTDLSGDRKTEQNMMSNSTKYDRLHACPIGTLETHSILGNARISPLALARTLPEAMDLDDNPIPHDQEIRFPMQSPMSSVSGKSIKTIDMEVSGIGGIYPADNFAINVRSLHAKLEDGAAPERAQHRSSHHPHRLGRILRESGMQRKTRSTFRDSVLSTSMRALPPSALPPATCFMSLDGSDSESEDEDNGVHDFLTISPVVAQYASPPSAAPQRIEMDYSDDSDDGQASDHESSDYCDDDDDDTSSEGSLDLLATARALDPDAVRAREREYDAHIAERFAEELPAGSSAATAGGGGSGFNSPASDVDLAEYEEAQRARHGLAKQPLRSGGVRGYHQGSVIGDEEDESEEDESED